MRYATGVTVMSDSENDDVEALGWRLDVDAEADELRLKHAKSDTAYILDARGNLTIVGDGDIGDEIRELQELLASALAGDGNDVTADGEQRAAGCAIECDESTEAMTIASDTKITMEAPNIEVAAGQLDVDADGAAELSAAGSLTFEGAIIELN